ncbi:MAG TPA: SRPBCC family protein [Gemmataceae bacterium]|jgi:ligand-binding SRPBCC domain-containing protein
MPRFETIENLTAPLSRVFGFFSRPAHLIEISPPELHFRLLSAPEQLTLGARIALQGRRWGLSQRIVSEVTVWEPEERFVDEQREGPFKQWVHTHRFEALPDGGTRLTDCIDYETPGGLLGFILTAAAVERELKWIFAYRCAKLAKLLDGQGCEPRERASGRTNLAP